MKLNSPNIITAVLVLAGFLSIAWWLARDPVEEFVTTEPGLDNRGAGAVIADIQIGEFFESLGAMETSLEETWPRFRGEIL